MVTDVTDKIHVSWAACAVNPKPLLCRLLYRNRKAPHVSHQKNEICFIDSIVWYCAYLYSYIDICLDMCVMGIRITEGIKTGYSIHLMQLAAVRITLQWCHNELDGVSNHQPHVCSLKRLFRWRSKNTSKFRVNGLCEANSPVTGEIPAQKASNAENVSICWRRHEYVMHLNLSFVPKSVCGLLH